MWVNENKNDNEQYIFCKAGLFPSPIHPYMNDEDEYEDIMKRFYNLGIFVAKVIFDDRLIDLPFSEPFCKLLINRKLTIKDFNIIYPELGKTINQFIELIKLKKDITSDNSLSEEQKKKEKISSITIRNGKIEDLYLLFTVPGHDDWELKKGGKNISLNIHNIEEYVKLIIEFYFEVSIRGQIDCFINGFNTVFPISTLHVFTESEILILISGSDDKSDWSPQSILENLKFQAGYNSSSLVIKYLVDILSEFNVEERRDFLRFLTGSPRLPIGGFKSLNSKFTITKKRRNPS